MFIRILSTKECQYPEPYTISADREIKISNDIDGIIVSNQTGTISEYSYLYSELGTNISVKRVLDLNPTVPTTIEIERNKLIDNGNVKDNFAMKDSKIKYVENISSYN